MEKPESLKYEVQGHNVAINTLDQIIDVDGVECLDGGIIRHNGQDAKMLVRIDNKPDLVKMVADWRAEWDAYNAYKAAELAANVPGLNELRKARDAAYNDEHRYSHQMDRMMDDEQNDGVNPPTPINQSLRAIANDLAKQYPRAAIYLKAEGYTLASNFKKYGAGKDAMEIIATGGSIEDAQATLNNWIHS